MMTIAQQLTSGMLLGGVIAMLFYNMALYLATRYRSYLIYIPATLSFALLVALRPSAISLAPMILTLVLAAFHLMMVYLFFAECLAESAENAQLDILAQPGKSSPVLEIIFAAYTVSFIGMTLVDVRASLPLDLYWLFLTASVFALWQSLSIRKKRRRDWALRRQESNMLADRIQVDFQKLRFANLRIKYANRDIRENSDDLRKEIRLDRHSADSTMQSLAEVSHDLKQPLHSIRMFCEILSINLTNPADVVLVDRLTMSSKALTEGVLEVLNLAVIEVGRQESPESIELGAFFSELQIRYQQESQELLQYLVHGNKQSLSAVVHSIFKDKDASTIVSKILSSNEKCVTFGFGTAVTPHSIPSSLISSCLGTGVNAAEDDDENKLSKLVFRRLCEVARCSVTIAKNTKDTIKLRLAVHNAELLHYDNSRNDGENAGYQIDITRTIPIYLENLPSNNSKLVRDIVAKITQYTVKTSDKKPDVSECSNYILVQQDKDVLSFSLFVSQDGISGEVKNQDVTLGKNESVNARIRLVIMNFCECIKRTTDEHVRELC